MLNGRVKFSKGDLCGILLGILNGFLGDCSFLGGDFTIGFFFLTGFCEIAFLDLLLIGFLLAETVFFAVTFRFFNFFCVLGLFFGRGAAFFVFFLTFFFFMTIY